MHYVRYLVFPLPYRMFAQHSNNNNNCIPHIPCKDHYYYRELQKCFDLFYYDGLANQKESIRLTISNCRKRIDINSMIVYCTTIGSDHARTDSCRGSGDSGLTPPIELCIKTRQGLQLLLLPHTFFVLTIVAFIGGEVPSLTGMGVNNYYNQCSTVSIEFEYN